MDRQQEGRRAKTLNILLNLVFYFAFAALLCVLVYPYTSFYYNKPFFIPFGQKLNTHDIILVKGESFFLSPLSIQRKVTYTSSDFKVAEVNTVGRVTAKRIGEAVIKVNLKKKSSKCRVRVVDLNKREITVRAGESRQLKIQGKAGRVLWESKDKNIAAVGKKGKIKGIHAGETWVIAKLKNKQIKCKINVLPPAN